MKLTLKIEAENEAEFLTLKNLSVKDNMKAISHVINRNGILIEYVGKTYLIK